MRAISTQIDPFFSDFDFFLFFFYIIIIIFLAEGVRGSNQYYKKVRLVPKEIPTRWYVHRNDIPENIAMSGNVRKVEVISEIRMNWDFGGSSFYSISDIVSPSFHNRRASLFFSLMSFHWLSFAWLSCAWLSCALLSFVWLSWSENMLNRGFPNILRNTWKTNEKRPPPFPPPDFWTWDLKACLTRWLTSVYISGSFSKLISK